jgi:hypothetical protein
MRLPTKIIIIVFMMTLISCSQRDKLTNQLISVTTSEHEALIAKNINKNCKPETFIFRDITGKDLNLNGFSDHDLKSVSVIELVWPDNFRIKHKVINKANIRILIGE